MPKNQCLKRLEGLRKEASLQTYFWFQLSLVQNLSNSGKRKGNAVGRIQGISELLL